MKILDQAEDPSPAISYAGLIEKIEILRSMLRWASKLERADKILVLYEGAIAEQGRHEELVQRKGMYYQLVQKQLSAG